VHLDYETDHRATDEHYVPLKQGKNLTTSESNVALSSLDQSPKMRKRNTKREEEVDKIAAIV